MNPIAGVDGTDYCHFSTGWIYGNFICGFEKSKFITYKWLKQEDFRRHLDTLKLCEDCFKSPIAALWLLARTEV